MTLAATTDRNDGEVRSIRNISDLNAQAQVP